MCLRIKSLFTAAREYFRTQSVSSRKPTEASSTIVANAGSPPAYDQEGSSTFVANPPAYDHEGEIEKNTVGPLIDKLNKKLFAMEWEPLTAAKVIAPIRHACTEGSVIVSKMHRQLKPKRINFVTDHYSTMLKNALQEAAAAAPASQATWVALTAANVIGHAVEASMLGFEMSEQQQTLMDELLIEVKSLAMNIAFQENFGELVFDEVIATPSDPVLMYGATDAFVNPFECEMDYI